MLVADTAARPANPLIYLVDDDEEMLNIAEMSLHGQGYELKRFNNPDDALAALAREPRQPDLLITDYAMLPFDGLELSARSKSAWPALKILMVSGTAGPEILDGAPVQLNHFLSKPYNPKELIRTVRTLLQAGR